MGWGKMRGAYAAECGGCGRRLSIRVWGWGAQDNAGSHGGRRRGLAGLKAQGEGQTCKTNPMRYCVRCSFDVFGLNGEEG